MITVLWLSLLLSLSLATPTSSTPNNRYKIHSVQSRSQPKNSPSLLDVASAKKGFVSSAMGAAAGQAMGGQVASVSDRENCVGCQFVWAKVNALLDQSSGYEAVKDAFERTCANMPNVFYDVCDVMFDREDELIQMYLNNMKFKMMCDKTQICLE
jgi:hypothetical protein